MAAMRNTYNGFLRFNRFPLKHGTFDFGTTIGCVNNTLTFSAVFTNGNLMKPAQPIFISSTTLMRALPPSQFNRECLISCYFAFCLVAFMLGPCNMRPARGVCLYKHLNSYDKVVSSEPNT